MVLIPFNQAHHPVHMCGVPFRKIGDIVRTVPQSVRFKVVFIDQVEAVLITQLVPKRRLRVMRSTHRIDVQFLHQF